MIIVLTMGRSGSSLLMQTLNILGARIIGQAFNDNPSEMHISQNPKGYFEHPEIYYRGLKAKAFKQLTASDTVNPAIKMDVKHFIDPDSRQLWLDAKDRIQAIFLSIRTPSEQARSEFTGDKGPVSEEDRQNEFFFTTQFLNNYVSNYKHVAKLLATEFSDLNSCVQPIDFADALQNRDQYVERVARAVEILPSAEKLENARTNIEGGLYRIKKSSLEEYQLNWTLKLGAQDVYDGLKQDNWIETLSALQVK